MSRFGTTGTFSYDTGDVFAEGTGIFLDVQDMFQFPFETTVEADNVSYRSKTGKTYQYQNYSNDVHSFNWVSLRESTRGSLFTMANSPSILTFKSPTNAAAWGTYRIVPGSWSDSEVTHERYDVSFSIEKQP